MDSDLISVKKYATKHKMSIFEVNKLINNGKLEVKEIKKDGKVTRYIVSGSKQANHTKQHTDSTRTTKVEGSEIEKLKREIDYLKSEIESIKKILKDHKLE